MARTPNKHGGGAQTNRNGLHFEQTTSLNDALIQAGYDVENHVVYFEGYEIGRSVPQTRIYSHFLTPNGINFANYNSKAWRPDEAFINYKNRTVYIIEKKFQNCSGSVDEKLPSCHFKKWEYEKLFAPLGYEVEFIYIAVAEAVFVLRKAFIAIPSACKEEPPLKPNHPSQSIAAPR